MARMEPAEGNAAEIQELKVDAGVLAKKVVVRYFVAGFTKVSKTKKMFICIFASPPI